MKVIGIDPGTATWDFVVLEDGNFSEERTISTRIVKEKPDEIIKFIKKFDPCIVAAPSGYGLPLKKISDLCNNDFFQINLKKENKKGKISDLGLTKVLKLLIKNKISGYIIPAVKHLPTVPAYRKINKIDMGTPDKVCSSALAISRYKDYGDASFILAEIGSAFNAFIAVEKGKIIDGIGGTLASSGMMSSGKMDGEIAYLLGDFEKEILFRGGANDIDKKFANNYFIEGILKDIASLAAFPGYTGKSPNEVKRGINLKTIILSGSMSRDLNFVNNLKNKIKNSELFTSFKVKKLMDISNSAFASYTSKYLNELKLNSSHAAQGSAIIADGLSGGKYEKLVEHLELKRAKGSVFDYIYSGEFFIVK